MAAMDQAKLDAMCGSINSAAENYVSQVTNSVINLGDVFNENWISNSSKSLAAEITDCLNSLAEKITGTFSAKNDSISAAVSNFNIIENESISYSGFSFGKPNTEMNLNVTLPNGKVGVADNADISTVNNPMHTLVTSVNSILDEIVNKVQNADAFDADEQASLTTGVTNIKNKFNEEMTELEESLKTRMSGEISERDKLNSANKGHLEA